MTMKYTHVGIEDQAKALAGLPSLHIRCTSDVFEGLSVSPPVAKNEAKKRKNPCLSKGSGVVRHPVSVGVAVEAAGIEPASVFDVSEVSTSICENCHDPCAARALHSSGTSGQSLSPDDASWHCQRITEFQSQIEFVDHAWPELPEHVRASILLLVQAALSQ
jgi:hypothetical protein